MFHPPISRAAFYVRNLASATCSSNAAKTAQAAFCGLDRTDILERRSDGVEGVLDGGIRCGFLAGYHWP